MLLTLRAYPATNTTDIFPQTNFSFQLGLINSCLQLVATILSIPLGATFGRRDIFLWGSAINCTFLILLGICATISQNSGTNYAQAIFGILISFVYAGSLGPIAYSIIAETSSVRLRALSTGIGRGAYYVAEIPMIFLASQMRVLRPGASLVTVIATLVPLVGAGLIACSRLEDYRHDVFDVVALLIFLSA